jgi:hypothetical protein
MLYPTPSLTSEDEQVLGEIEVMRERMRHQYPTRKPFRD